MAVLAELKKESPIRRANFLSQIFFWWLHPLLTLGYQRALNLTDLYKIPNEDKSNNLAEQLEAEWRAELELGQRTKSQTLNSNSTIKKSKNLRGQSNSYQIGQENNQTTIRPSLARALIRMFYKKYLICTFFMIFRDSGLRVVQPVALGSLLRFFAHPEEFHPDFWYWGYLMAGIIVTSSAITAIFYQQTMFALQHIGMQVRVSCSALVFRKVLGLSQHALQQSDSDVGQVLSLVSNDVTRLDEGIKYMIQLWAAPLNLLVTTLVLWIYCGPSCLMGILFLALFVPWQLWMGKKFFSYRKCATQRTGWRIRLVSEVIDGIRLIKMCAWEQSFIQRVVIARREEMKFIGRVFDLCSLNSTLNVTWSKFIIFLTLLLYILLGNTVTLELIFVTLALYNSVRVNIAKFFPTAIQTFANVRVSIARLEAFLLLGEAQKVNVNINKGPNFCCRLVKASSPVTSASENPCSLTLTSSRSQKVSRDPSTCHLFDSDIVLSLNDVMATWSTSQNQGRDLDSKKQVTHEETQEVMTLQTLNLSVKRQELIAIVGRVGSGKTSILLTILKELPSICGDVRVSEEWANQGIAYAAQSPWLFSGTLRDNILFGLPFDSLWYKEVIRACALSQDLDDLPCGDMTFVGDQGTMLSGGQKSRVGLARAVYSDANLLLLDDPLSSVDVKSGKFIFQQCIQGLLREKEKTVILVTHQLQHLQLVDRIVVLKDGAIEAEGSYEDLIDRGVNFYQFSDTESNHSNFENTHGSSILNPSSYSDFPDDTLKNPDQPQIVDLAKNESTEELIEHSQVKSDQDKPKECGQHLKMMPAPSFEKREDQTSESNVGNRAVLYLQYFRAGSNSLILALLLLSFIFCQFVQTSSDVWLALWAKAEAEGSSSPVNVKDQKYYHDDNDFEGNKTQLIPESTKNYPENGKSLEQDILDFMHQDPKIELWGYCGLIGILFLAAVWRNWLFYFCVRRSSVNLHKNLFQQVIRAPILFFQQTPSGQILNRFSKDFDTIDNDLPTSLAESGDVILNIFGTVILVGVLKPLLLPPILLLMALVIWLHRLYVRTVTSLKRLESIAKSPVLSHLVTSIRGAGTIRAFKKEKEWIREFHEHQDLHSASWFLVLASFRWFATWLDWITVAFVACVTFGFVLTAGSSGASVGLAISSVLNLTAILFTGARHAGEVAVHMVSVERVLQYSDIESEAEFESSPDKKPEKSWPTGGKIQFKNVSLFYNPTAPPVLLNLSFTINPGEKVAIVGRTGSGKSSLVSLLFRLTEPTGEIYIDNLLINESGVGLKDLRSKISIIPQDPALFTTSLRENLDPENRFEDFELWKVLEQVGLRDLFSSLDEHMADRGSQLLSFGQKQLLCVARALLRKSPILVMDEATAQVDLRTDQVIHQILDAQFEHSTVICVAHRLNSVLGCDRIMVMDTGKILEFDEPWKLLRDKSSVLWNLVQQNDEATAKELKALAEKRAKIILIKQPNFVHFIN